MATIMFDFPQLFCPTIGVNGARGTATSAQDRKFLIEMDASRCMANVVKSESPRFGQKDACELRKSNVTPRNLPQRVALSEKYRDAQFA